MSCDLTISTSTLKQELFQNSPILTHVIFIFQIFDVNQLHSHMGLALEATKTSSDTRSLLYRAPVLQLRTIVGISLLEDHEDISQTPCWLLVINLGALRALDDQDGL